MKKIFLSAVLILIFSCVSYGEVVENDLEAHKIIGGLYSLVSAVELNARAKVDVNSTVRFFEKIPAGWQNTVKIERDKNSIWVGVSVEKSSARSYLRAHASELGIKENPGGAEWLSSDFVWLKAADIAKKKINSIEFSAAEGDGKLFFKAGGSWWLAYPAFNGRATREILDKHEDLNAPELHAPEEQTQQASDKTSIYELVKPSSIRVPDEIRMGRKKNSFDEMAVEVGDVVINPIPNVHY